MQRATAKLAGQTRPSKWARRLSPVDTHDPERIDAGWLPYRD
jgi:hypothetical protein